MRVIAHISDLHFGREDRVVAEALLLDLLSIHPQLIVISGDLTQRARHREFLAARNFLQRLPFPVLTVPGNHDIPLYNLFRRFSAPYKLYRDYISDDLNPSYIDDEIAVLGLNTAHGLTIKNGQLIDEHILHIENKFNSLDKSIFKVLVTHHHFMPPPGQRRDSLMAGIHRAVKTIESCQIDLMLAGHLHKGYTHDLKHHYAIERSVIVAHAGTAISTRGRGESNSYNLITIEREDTYITLREWNGTSFADAGTTHYRRTAAGWAKFQRD